jgi:RNA polymerase sigma factor (sigma-70 family)
MREEGPVSDSTPGAPPSADVALVYERRAAQLWAFARRLGLTSEQAEDAVQEAFARLVRTQRWDGPVHRPEAWLFQAVNNLAMDQHRRAGHVREIRSSEDDEPTATGPIASLVVADAPPDPSIDLWAAVDRLPERQRAVVYLRYRADFDFATIARILSISEVGARANAFRALRRLRREVDR